MEQVATARTRPESIAAAEAPPSAVAWGAIIAGSVATAATTIMLLTLGSGLGLTTVSPWSGEGVSAKTFGYMAAIWLIIVWWLAAALGGYLTGRLRVRWTNMHSDEVYFRDTAHGFLSWAFALVVITLMVAPGVMNAIGSTARGVGSAAASVAQGAAQGAAQAGSQNGSAEGINPSGYFVDALFRSDNPAPNASSDDVRGETARILARSLSDGTLAPADRTYLSRLVAARTGLSPDDAQRRVDDILAQVKQAETKAKAAADAARKAAARAAIASALALAIGAFIAAVAAGIGGRGRDE